MMVLATVSFIIILLVTVDCQIIFPLPLVEVDILLCLCEEGGLSSREPNAAICYSCDLEQVIPPLDSWFPHL